MKSLLTFLSFLSTFTMALAQSHSGQTKIEIEKEGDMMQVTGVYKNTSGKNQSDLTYKLKVERQGKSGTSSSNQGGKFSAKKNEEVKLSTSNVNISEGDSYTLHLTITDADGNLIGEKIITEQSK